MNRLFIRAQRSTLSDVGEILRKPRKTKIIIHFARMMPHRWWVNIYKKICFIHDVRPDIKFQFTGNQKK